MKIKALYLALACAALLPFLPADLSAGAPLKIGFQGRLDESGQPAEGTKNFVFKLYDAVSGGNLVWTGDAQAVALANGVFNATLAAGTPALSTAAFAGASYIEITVDGVPLSPRQELVSAPYAMVAQALAPDAVFSLSTASVTSGKFGDDRVQISTAVISGLGSMALAGSETDPLFVVSVSSLIVAGDITNWDSAYGWGDHATAGYATGGDITAALADYETTAAHQADLASYAALAATQAFTGANTFTSSAAFTFQHAAAPGVRVSSGLVVAAGRTGLGTASPNSILSVNGSLSLAVKTITVADSPYSLTDQDSTVLVDAAGGNVNVVLPPAAGVTGRVYTVKRIDLGATFVTLLPYGWDIPLNETIEGQDNMDLSGQFQYAMVQSGGLLDYDGDTVATPVWVILASN